MNGDTAVERFEVIEEAPIQQVITEDFVERLERAADLYQTRYLPVCLKLTNVADWINHGTREKPRFSLQSSGAEKIGNPFGMMWDRPIVTKHEREDDKGKFYEYEIEGIIKTNVLRRYGWFTGNCSSRDVFFNARGRFDEGDIRKAAFSNWLVNGITRLAGIRNPTSEMLQKAGLDPNKIEVIDYSGRKTPEAEQGTISDAQGKRLWAICKSQNVGEEALRVHLLDNYDLKSSKDIKRRDYDTIIAWAQAGGQKTPEGDPNGSK